MRRLLLALSLALMLGACGVREQRPQIGIVPVSPPPFPAPPVDTSRPVGPPLEDWIECLFRRGWQSCPGPDLTLLLGSATSGAKRS